MECKLCEKKTKDIEGLKFQVKSLQDEIKFLKKEQKLEEKVKEQVASQIMQIIDDLGIASQFPFDWA